MALVESGLLVRRYDEQPQPGMSLGRHLKLDARSLAYMVENDVTAMSTSYESQLWQRVIPVLDQGHLGSCTGNAATGALGTEPFYGKVGHAVLPSAGDPAPLEQFAVALYGDATRIDPYQGSYPPQDTGSNGLSVCQVLKNRGTISGYRWASTAYGFLTLLQSGPVLVGMRWYKAFFEPDHNAFVDADPHWHASGVAGGHEIEAIGVEIDRRNVYDSVILFANSWTTRYGDHGRFRMRLRTLGQVEDVDLKQYTV